MIGLHMKYLKVKMLMMLIKDESRKKLSKRPFSLRKEEPKRKAKHDINDVL